MLRQPQITNRDARDDESSRSLISVLANSDDHLQLVKDTMSPSSAERPILSGASACFRHNGCCWEPTSPFASGRRALDILIALVERAGEVVSKDRLVARVSPNTFVEDGNLNFQIGGLRRALGEGRSGSRYLVTIPRRGYLFVAPVTIAEEAAERGATGCRGGVTATNSA